MDTRTAILEKNFEAIYKSGFQAVRTDKVVADLGITKGAFYHYFPDKFGLHTWLQDHPIQDSFLLVKGSRGIQLESVLAFLENSK